MGFVFLGVGLYLLIGSILISREANRELLDLGVKPWASGWYFKRMFRLLPEPEQAVYDRYIKRGWLLMLTGASFIGLAIIVTGSW